MSGRQIFWAIFALIILIKDPHLVTTAVNGILNFFQGNPNG